MYENVAFIFFHNIYKHISFFSAVGDIVGSGATARLQPDPQPAALRYRDVTERAEHRPEPQYHR